MTNTEFLSRDRGTSENPLFQATQMRFRLVDGGIVLAFLSAFVGLLLLLSK